MGLARKNKRDGRDALLALKKLFDVASTGQQLEYFYDIKKCHVAHEFLVAGIPQKIWRIRKNYIRIYFYYSQGKIIYLTAVLAKRRGKLSLGELRHLEDEVALYLEAKNNQDLKEIATKMVRS